MKLAGLLLFTVCLIGCSSGSKPSSEPQTVGDAMSASPQPGGTQQEPAVPAEKETFKDDVFKVPPYPNAERIAYTSLIMNVGGGKSYHRKYTSNDPMDKIVDYFKTEGAKVGKIEENPLSNGGKDLQRIFVLLPDGNKLQFEVAKGKDGKMVVSSHFVPVKK